MLELNKNKKCICEEQEVINNMNNEEMKKYLEYVPVTNYEIRFGDFNAYAKKKVDISNLNYDIIINTLFPYLDKSYVPSNQDDYSCYSEDRKCDFYIKEDTIKDEILNRYGSSIKYKHQDILVVNGLYVCNLSGDVYGCFNPSSSTNNLFDGNIGFHHHKITSFEEKDNYLYIYEDYYYLKYYVVESEDMITFQVFKNYLEEEPIVEDEFFVKDFLKGDSNYNYENDIFEMLGDKVAKYKHTYVKTKNGYNWVSTEPVS